MRETRLPPGQISSRAEQFSAGKLSTREVLSEMVGAESVHYPEEKASSFGVELQKAVNATLGSFAGGTRRGAGRGNKVTLARRDVPTPSPESPRIANHCSLLLLMRWDGYPELFLVECPQRVPKHL